jgi:hypothetical protein
MAEYRLNCEKHGDVTEAVMYFEYEVIDPANNETKKVHDVYCLECLNNLLKELQESGRIGKITASTVKP